jgi:putative peptide zinc metalloprotease protein
MNAAASVPSPSSAPLLSSQWFRVAPLRPRLGAQLSVKRVSYRREPWYVLENTASRRSFRVNAAAYAFIGRCTGGHTMQALWNVLLADQKDAAPTQDELLQLMTDLYGAALIEFDQPPDFGAGGRIGPAAAGGAAKNSLLAMRLPLGRPDAWLDRLYPRLAWLFAPWVLAVWAACVLLGVAVAALNADTLVAHARLWSETPRLLLLAFVAYPFIKAFHELGHALTLRHFGARVPEWGVTLMVFSPVPYVDGSAAASLPSASQRLLVSAAGIMVELFFASLALMLALSVQPGWVRDGAFVVFLIGSVSTVLVNGNPLMRFDGYHALTDLLQLPNLAPRSTRWWNEHLRARLLGGTIASPLVSAEGEARWLWFYAPASLAYRAVASIALVAWLGHLSLVFGMAIAAYLLWGFAGKPLWTLVAWLRGSALDDASRSRAIRRAAVIGAAVLFAVGLLPLPYSSVVQGVVWLPDAALVRAQTDGFIERVEVRDGQTVQAGDALFTLSSPSLDAERASLAQRITALDVDRFKALSTDLERAANAESELDAAQAALDRADERLRQLTVRAASSGIVSVTHADDLPGRYVKRGELLAHVMTGEPTRVRAAIPQEQATLVQQQSRSVSVSLVGDEVTAWPAHLQSGSAGTVAQLPSAALGLRSGGSVVTDPLDKQGLTPSEGVVLADVVLPHSLGDRVGGRAWVRFDHGFSPLAWQAARRAQQLFLRHFNPTQ